MQLVTLYLSTAFVFFIVDIFGLKYIIRPVFVRHIEDMLLDSYRFGPALVFYLFYILGLVYFVSAPALRDGSPGQAALGGALLGGLAYGTYEFTNYATLKGWHLQMVVVDLSWGMFLTGLAAGAGVLITRAIG